MEIQFPLLPTLLLQTVLILFLAPALIKRRRKTKAVNLPPGPWKLPIIGNLHQLLGRPQHRTLRDLSVKYAPNLLHLRLGQVDHIVVSSLEAAKEILQTHDLVFASRPRLMVTDIVFYGTTDVVFNTYGSYWRQLRKICVLELLSARRVRSFSAIREGETANTIKFISSLCTSGGAATVNITRLFWALSCSIISRATFGSKCAHADRFISVVGKATAFLDGLSLSDLFPSLQFVDTLSGASSFLKKIHRQIDEILDVIIQEHRVKREQGIKDDDDQDFVNVMLGIQEKGGLEFQLTMTNVKAVILDLFAGGTETTAIIIVWAMAELIRHPAVMQKAQSEVRQALKGKAKVEDADVQEMHYMKLVIKETLRLHPPAPLIVPRIGRESCQVMGFDIPEGTRVLVNAWAIGRDPRYWEEGTSFKPERFEGSQVDFMGSSFEFLPFGGGRRVCPGITYALANLEIFLASLLYHFDWQLPDGIKPSDVDMTEKPGAVASRKLDLCLIAKPHVV